MLNKPDRESIVKKAKEAEVRIKFSDSLGRVQIGVGGPTHTTKSEAEKEIKKQGKK